MRYVNKVKIIYWYQSHIAKALENLSTFLCRDKIVVYTVKHFVCILDGGVKLVDYLKGSLLGLIGSEF